MKKKGLIFYCIILMLFCQDLLPVSAITEEKRVVIVDNCGVVRENLRNVQRADARTRTFLGSRFEMILSKFIMPLNMRLVENNLSDVDLIENQNELVAVKLAFGESFISYQQELENLVLMDCKAEPEKFYEKLEKVREKRKVVNVNVVKMKELVAKNLNLVVGLKGEVK